MSAMNNNDTPNQTAKDTLLRAWDNLDQAAAAIETAQPRQMTAAIERLEKARLAMRSAVFAWGSSSNG